jgi:crossover junction endodeoxyribonuclease RuvC
MIIVGIDAGQTGAVAKADNGRIIDVADMPTMARLHGKGQQVDAGELASILLDMRHGNEMVKVLIEAVSAMPGQGSSSMFRFGESVGVVIGVCGALHLPVFWVTPQRWKKNAGLIGKEKDAARTLMIQQQPQIADMLTRKKDIGRADACCIALYGAK